MIELPFDIPLTEGLPDLDLLQNTHVPAGERISLIGRKPDLAAHLSELLKEFPGEPYLHFYHAALVVLLRRGIDTDLAHKHFRAIWGLRRSDLLSGLSARWLISACDTIMDHDEDPYELAMACSAANFLNTVKLYETESLTYGEQVTPLSAMKEAWPLFDGMTSFMVGGGNMIHNLRKRTESICAVRPGSLAADRMREAFRRVDRADAVYTGLLALHREPATRWGEQES